MVEPHLPADEHLLRFVAGRDVNCPICGYNLRDLRTNRCPECGDELELGLRLAIPRQGALITGLIALAAGAGLGGLLLIYAVILSFTRDRFSRWDMFVTINATGFLVHAVAIAIWVANWHRIRRMNPAGRRILVILCCAMPIAFVIVFTSYIR